MAVNPQSGEGLGAYLLWRFFRSAMVLLQVFMCVISEPVDSRQYARFASAALAQVKAQVRDEAGVARPAQLRTSVTEFNTSV